MSIHRTQHDTWMVRWRDDQHRQCAKSFRKRQDADAFSAALVADRQAARAADARKGQRYEGAEVVGVVNPHAFHVYCMWGYDDERPLYIGSSIQVMSRIAWHLQRPEKRGAVRRVTMLRCATREDMLALERRLIDKHQPPLNVMGVVRGRTGT